MARVAAQLSDEYPESNDRWGAQVSPLREWLIGPRLTRLGGFLLAAVAVFLLMACASVSTLLLARATSRAKEMGVDLGSQFEETVEKARSGKISDDL